MINSIKNISKLFLIPILIGTLSTFSLPPYDLFFINFFTFPVLFFFIVSTDNKLSSFIFGWMFGFGYFISSLYWIANSLTFDETFKPLIPLSIIIIPLFLGIFYGLITLIASLIKIKKNLSSILIFSLIFAIIEFMRGHVLGGFPWNLIVYSLTNYLYSIQILSVIGTYSLNLLSITLFTLPIILFFKQRAKFKLMGIFLLLAIILFNNLYGYLNINNFNKTNKEKINYKIKIINPKITIDRFFNTDDSEPLIREIINLSKTKLNEKNLYIFPEGIFSHIYYSDLKYYREIFKENFSDQDIIILGMNTQKIENGKNKVFNSLVVVDNNLKLISKYDKIKLVPFGEFLPLENFLSSFGLKKITEGYQSFSSSKSKREVIELNLNNFSFVPLICYEIIYSGKIISSNKNNNFIINISEDGWFGETVGLDQHFSHSIFRSIEEGKNLIRSSNNGISGYINPLGIVVEKLESTKKGMITVDYFYKPVKTIFGEHGNKIFIYITIIYISLFFLIKLFENRRANEKRLFIYK